MTKVDNVSKLISATNSAAEYTNRLVHHFTKDFFDTKLAVV